MKLSRRTRARCVRFGVVLAAVAVLTGCVSPDSDPAADNYPTRPITLIVPFEAGGGTDTGARLLAAAAEDALGQPIVVENRPGGGSQLGLTEVAQAEPDGYTIGAFNMPAANMIVLDKSRDAAFDLDSFDYILNHVEDPLVIAVQPDAPYETLQEFIDAHKQTGLRVGTSGARTPEHLAALQLQEATGLKTQIAHFDGAAGSMQRFLGGHTDVAITTPTLGKDLKVLATLTSERLPSMPDVPTAVESGFDIEMTSSRGFVTPAGVPDAALTKLRDALGEAAGTPDHQAQMEEASLPMSVMVGKEYETHVDEVQAQSEQLAGLIEQGT